MIVWMVAGVVAVLVLFTILGLVLRRLDEGEVPVVKRHAWFGTFYEANVPGFGLVSADTRAGCQRLVDRILSGRENWPGGV